MSRAEVTCDAVDAYIGQLASALPGASYDLARKIYAQVLNDPNLSDEVLRWLGRNDRFFLMFGILRRADIMHPWLYEQCRTVEKNTDDHLDIWARDHYKSSIITFAGTIQEVLRNPEITVGLFSHTRPIAKGFLYQIQQELEGNEHLKALYPEVLWQDPRKDAPTWSLDSGLVVKRKSNPKERTWEAWGLVDGQPTSKHFGLMVYDDVVTEESVSTPDMIAKTTQRWELSRNLTAVDRVTGTRRTWYIGTRYHFADTYATMLSRGVAVPRICPATDTGTIDGSPVFLSQEDWEKKLIEMSEATIACQQLLNPLAGQLQEFKPEWIRRYEVRPELLNVALIVDPANSKKSGSSNTAFAVIGIDSQRNKYLLDGACHRMSLTERWAMLKKLRQKWLRAPGVQVVKVGYERYGMQSDMDHFEEMMRIEEQYFPIHEVSWAHNTTSQAKDDRIRRLIPDHQNWRFFYPYESKDSMPTKLQMNAATRGKAYLAAKPILCKDHEKKPYNLVQKFLQNEYNHFPFTIWKDLFDAMSRFYDMELHPPMLIMRAEDLMPEYYGEA